MRPHPVPRATAGGRRRPLAPLARAPYALAAVALVAGIVAAGARPAAADPVRDAQWYLDDLRLPAAWELSRGRGATIAILDTGVDPRADSLRGRVRTGLGSVPASAKRHSRKAERHGTDIATVAAGGGPKPGAPFGVLGAAPEASILSVRVISERGGDGGEPLVDVAGAIRWAADNGADVINMSFGEEAIGTPASRGDERAAIRYALDRGAVLVASAGNSGNPNDRDEPGRNEVDLPAGYTGVIAVGATTRDHTAAPFSSRHTYVTISAPGVDIIDRADGTYYYYGDGTSQAAALVSGTVALIKAKYPELSPAQIRGLLIETASHRPKAGHSSGIGFGIVNPLGALERAARLTSEPQRVGAPSYDGPAYFGAGPPAAVPAGADATGRQGDATRRLLLGGTGVALLLPSSLLLVRNARRERARRRGATVFGAGRAEPARAWPEQARPGQAGSEQAAPVYWIPGRAPTEVAREPVAPWHAHGDETAAGQAGGPAVPGTAVPGTAVPGTAVPGTAVPGTAVPGVAAPGGAEPGSSRTGPRRDDPRDDLPEPGAQAWWGP